MEVNKVIYILLAVFLGSFGIHKFYAGKSFQGIMHILFCWTAIPHILAIISAILTLFRPADENGNIQCKNIKQSGVSILKLVRHFYIIMKLF